MVQLNGFIDINLPNEDYQNAEAISKSRLATADVSFKKYFDTYLAHDKEGHKSTPGKSLGTLIHECVLEPELFDEKYLVVPKMDKRTTEGKADFITYTNMCIEQDKEMILEQDVLICHNIRKSVHEHPIAGPMLKKAPLRETSFFWNDPETGLPCKCRLDVGDMEYRIILDLKSAADPQDHKIEGANWEYRHHFTPPHYAAGVENVTGEVIDAYIFLAIEKERPFDCKLFTMDTLSLQAGQNHVRQLMHGLAKCYETGIWPGYPTEIRTIGLPRYALAKYFDPKQMGNQ